MERLDSGQVIQEMSKNVPEDLGLEAVIWGKREDCVEQIERFMHRAGSTYPDLTIRGKNRNEAITLVGNEVLLYFREIKESTERMVI
jgi:hypothetical protein